nr:putative ribonuclease H-like domain-containing protein [Tanacetum cinerariifolium]
NMSYLSDFKELNGGYVAFEGNSKGDQDKPNLLSPSLICHLEGTLTIAPPLKLVIFLQKVTAVKAPMVNVVKGNWMCDKKNSVLFTDTGCLVLSPEFKLPDENQVLLRVPWENNMYNVDLKNIVPSRNLTCLFAKATLDESNLWHRRLGHINFKTMNKLVKCNLVRGLPTKVFNNDHTCVAYKKGKQHRASCKTKPVSYVNQPLQRLHIDLFGHTFVKSLNKKSYCLVVTDDYSRFTWVFFLATKDETSPILKNFITDIENQLSLKVKIIRSDNGTEFKNSDLNQFCGIKGIKREFSVPRTPQQNKIAERKNRTLIEAARTMLADSLLPISFWAEAVNTACFMRPFDCPVTILNTLDPLGKFDGKADDGFLVGYSNIDGDATFEVKKPKFEGRKPESEVHVYPSSSAKTKKHDDKTKRETKGKSPVELSTGYRNLSAKFEDFSDNSINEVNGASTLVPTVGKISTNNTNTFSAAVSPIPTTRVHKDHLVTQIIGDLSSATQTRSMTRMVKDQGRLTQINNKDFHTCMFACFLLQEEPKRVHQALKDPSWIVQEELLQFKMQKVSVLVDLPNGKRAIGHTQDEGINYEEVFAPVARIEAIRLFRAYSSFMGFMVYQIDVKSAFLYGTIKEEVYVCQPSGFEDSDYPDKMFSSESDVSIPASRIYDRYQSGEEYHVVPPPYTGTFMPPKPDLVFHDAPTVNETVPTAFNVELSTTKPNQDLSQSNRSTAPIIEDWVSDSKDESEGEPMTAQNAPSFVQTFEHVKPPRPSVKPVEHFIPVANLKTDIPKPKGHGNSSNRKACFVCKSLTHLIKDCDYYEKKMVQKPARNHAQRGLHQHYARMTHPKPHRHVVPTTVLTKAKLVPHTAARPVTTVVPHNNVNRPRPAKTVDTKLKSPPRRTIKHRPSPPASNFPPKVTTHKAPKGNPQHALKDKGVLDSGCSRHMTGNISYLTDFKEINGGYVAFGGNPKGGKITGKGKIKTGKLDFDDVYFVKELKFNLFSVSQMCDKKNSVLFTDTKCIVLSPDFKLPDENQVLLRVPRENNMYNVDLMNIVPSRDLTCLFAKATLDESNLWDKRLGHINFKTMNKLVKDPLGKFDGKADEGFLVGYSNTDGDATFEVKDLEFEVEKPESKVYVSPSSSAKTKKHDDKTNRQAKGKSHVELSIGFRNLSEKFEDFLITTLMSAVGPSNTADSPTHGKYSYVDPSQYPDDLNMPALEYITYSDDEEDVSTEADFTNLGTTITVSPILTTRVHKDHIVTQIIGDLSLATQTKSMTRMVKDQGGLTQINNEDFYTCMFAFFFLQEEANRVHQALKDSIWIEAMQEELLQFKMQKDIKSAFLYETIEEEVYVFQPPGFEDPDYPDKVYKVVTALYGLHQAPRAWYETLANYLLENSFQKGKIDQTLFIKKKKGNILLVQKQDGKFISQDEYVAKILRKFGLTNGKLASTPIDTEKPLPKDPDGEDVDVHTYRLMIGSLMYLTSSRPDIMFAICACACFQVTPKASHLHAVKRIFSDYAGARLDWKSTTKGC